jgi:hypothetical protein
MMSGSRVFVEEDGKDKKRDVNADADRYQCGDLVPHTEFDKAEYPERSRWGRRWSVQ